MSPSPEWGPSWWPGRPKWSNLLDKTRYALRQEITIESDVLQCLQELQYGDCHEIKPFDGHQHAPPRGERKASQTHGDSAWVDPQRCQCAPGPGRLAPVGIWVSRLSRFACWPTGLPSGKHARRMGGNAAGPRLQERRDGRSGTSQVARSEGSSGCQLCGGVSRRNRGSDG